MVLAAIDAGLLFEVVWASLLAGVAVTVLFSFVVLFTARSAESGRSGHTAASMAYALLSLIAFGAFGVIVGYAVHLILSKG